MSISWQDIRYEDCRNDAERAIWLHRSEVNDSKEFIMNSLGRHGGPFGVVFLFLDGSIIEQRGDDEDAIWPYADLDALHSATGTDWHEPEIVDWAKIAEKAQQQMETEEEEAVYRRRLENEQAEPDRRDAGETINGPFERHDWIKEGL